MPEGVVLAPNQAPPMPMIARPPLMWSMVVTHFTARPGLRNVLAPDEQPEPDPLGRLGDRGERRVALEDRLVRVAEDRQEVVPGPDVVVAEPLGALGRREERRPVAGLAPQVDAESSRPSMPPVRDRPGPPAAPPSTEI